MENSTPYSLRLVKRSARRPKVDQAAFFFVTVFFLAAMTSGPILTERRLERQFSVSDLG
jgi:hypothetical protein